MERVESHGIMVWMGQTYYKDCVARARYHYLSLSLSYLMQLKIDRYNDMFLL